MKKSFFLTTMISLSILSAYGQKNKTTEYRHSNIKKGVAIQGYDPVSYFGAAPRPGRSTYTTKHKGITYQFASRENKDKFIANMEKYIPQYGGWCAYAMGVDGSKVKIDPKTYKIVDGKLYLFYNFNSNNTLKSWNKGEEKLKNKADSYWRKIVNK